MKKIITLLFIVSLAFAPSLSFGQNQANMYLKGDINSWGADAMTYRALDTAEIFTPPSLHVTDNGQPRNIRIFSQTAPTHPIDYGESFNVVATQ